MTRSGDILVVISRWRGEGAVLLAPRGQRSGMLPHNRQSTTVPINKGSSGPSGAKVENPELNNGWWEQHLVLSAGN